MKLLAERARRRARGRVSGPLLIWVLVLLAAMLSFVVHLLGEQLMHRAQILQVAQAGAAVPLQPVPAGATALPQAPQLPAPRDAERAL